MTAIPLWVRRPAGERVGWLRTVDHKEIGVLYIGMGVVFFAVGGLEALLLRAQLPKQVSWTPRHSIRRSPCTASR